MEAKVIHIKLRRCGRRKPGRLYLTTSAFRSKDGILPPFIRIDPPIPYTGPRHRSPVVVDGEALLSRKPYAEFLAGASKDRLERESAKTWELETFGMPLAERLQTGNCRDCRSGEEALAVVVGLVTYDRYALAGIVRELGQRGIQTTPRAAESYASLVRAVQLAVAAKGSIASLVRIQAALWRLAGDLPSGRRENFVRFLALGLVRMNLLLDAQAMRQKYLVPTLKDAPGGL